MTAWGVTPAQYRLQKRFACSTHLVQKRSPLSSRDSGFARSTCTQLSSMIRVHVQRNVPNGSSKQLQDCVRVTKLWQPSYTAAHLEVGAKRCGGDRGADVGCQN